MLKFEKLDLSSNKISNIDNLENANFKVLKELYLNDNNISDIKVLEKVKFEKLNLAENKISDIYILEKIYFKELKELDLKDNNISDIPILEKMKLKKIRFNNIIIKKFSCIINYRKLKFIINYFIKIYLKNK